MDYTIYKRDELIELLEDRDETISEIEQEIDDLKERVDELESEPDFPNTLYGQLKEEIISKLRHLPLKDLQELEDKYCEKILGFERIED